MDQPIDRYHPSGDYSNLLRDAFDSNSNGPGEHSRLSSSDRQKVLIDWNQTRKAYPRDRCFHQLFEEQAERSPDAVAVESEGERLTYKALNLQANRLAHHLQELGLGPEVLAGVCLNPSLDLVVALLAILKAGGAYVPLDPAYPKDRLDYMIADSGMKVVIAREDSIGSLAAEGVQVVLIDQYLAASDRSSKNPASAVHADNLAYVIYTSGSTGRPKGVMVPHRGLVNYLCWAAEAYAIHDGAGALVHSSISFDLTITGLFAPLLVGGCVYLLPAEQTLESLATALHRGVDFSLVKITPAHLEMLCLQLEKGAAATKSFIIGGEALFGENLESWQECAPDSIMVNEYGPTETVVGCCVYVVPKHRRFAGTIPIGRPIANTQLYVLDERKEPVAIGATGELYIAGDGVARGYLNAPALTAEKFVHNPFVEGPDASAKMYRSGDLVRYLPDGNLEYLGRVDEQIKVRGYRIEPGEIEAALLTHSSVRNAAVIAHTDSASRKHLAAYVVSKDGATASASELRAHLRAKLPDYMVPATFTALPAFPLTPNGKIDRRALPQPDLEASMGGNDYIAPNTDTERKLAALWGESLQRPIGLHDNFFDLGGHSLLAIRLVDEINLRFNAKIEPLRFYQHPTIFELAEVLAKNAHETPAAELITVRDGRGSPVYFLNPPIEFVRLAKVIDADESFHFCKVPFLPSEAAIRSDTSAYPTIEEIAAPHATLIRENGLDSPCYLAGWSSHAIMAFEVAHQLQATGHTVDGLFLFDGEMKTPTLEALKVKWARHKRAIRANGIGHLWAKTRERLAPSARQGDEATLAKEILASPATTFLSEQSSWPIFLRIWNHALRNYRPAPLNSRAVLFRAEGTAYSDLDDYDGCLGWRDLFLKGLEVLVVPGEHFSMWKEPDVSALRRSWENVLGKVSRRSNKVLCSAPTVLAAMACVG